VQFAVSEATLYSIAISIFYALDAPMFKKCKENFKGRLNFIRSGSIQFVAKMLCVTIIIFYNVDII
jgi:hypothetical protein